MLERSGRIRRLTSSSTIMNCDRAACRTDRPLWPISMTGSGKLVLPLRVETGNCSDRAAIREIAGEGDGPNAQQTFASGKALLWRHRQVLAGLTLCATKLPLSRLRDSRMSGSSDPHPQSEFKAGGRLSFPEYTRRFQCRYAVQKRP